VTVYILGFVLSGQFLHSYSRLGSLPKVNFCKLLWQYFLPSQMLTTTQMTASKK